MLINGNLPLRFKAAELHYFNWLYSVAPCFAVNASKINIITDPRKFYDSLYERFKTANRRISVASLYIGTGALEKDLLKVTKENMMGNKSLKLNVLLDYQRGTRGVVNSRSLLQDFLTAIPEQCHISLYQTPRLHGSWSKALPARYNEIVGLQHMKLYIADDSVLLSGANCSNDYFERRQDRYIEIQDADLADFYCELIDEMSNYSKRCVKDGYVETKHASREAVTQEVNEKIINFIQRWKEKQDPSALSSVSDPNKDTWVFPLIQMGEFDIRQDERVTQGLLGSAPPDSLIRLATGYFNLTGEYADTLLKDCRANISLLMAHPNANGFMGAAGPAGGIPHAYSLIARKFWNRVEASNQTNRVQMLEYERPDWTFHAKGLWYYPPGSGVPWGTLVGSANLGERSVKRDLEAQAAIFTVSSELQEKLHNEVSLLHAHAAECSRELQERSAPLWVRATVGLFRTYF
ncbi:CDP-diacylglycerol--glycerol-3-phosphate 3-phosphatidyltransferase, mitochondrial isoform X1 [Leguminivora glycinivorella]|uniref:CDP-diacylglycerol--glycerol-3-phosphate 3-phosphatidyltransferase, mitochondrial isoform X1 n=2 Tax=Leguminivora glycinivorella TaxID=1035111 RepID=UPI00200EC18B|nr:CDP-diacylglycerol--glycerol-3-phosphate 3-phosphatidyltransferase, mitochondrial isoform X1 [Leguminivora glycinivorella]